MNEHALRVLEFEKVRTMLIERCLSSEGSARIAEEQIATDRETVERAQDLVAEYRAFLEDDLEPQELAFPAIREAVSRLRVEGAVLEGPELAAIAEFAESAARLGAAIGSNREQYPQLQERSGELPDLSQLVRRIRAVIDRTGEVKENEIPALRSIRKRTLGLQSEISRMAGAFLNDSRYARVLNADRPTVRDGRTVLAIAASHKSAIPGVVHEVSGSGRTVFLEPLQLVEKNNALAEAHEEYRRELLRLLRELSEACRQERAALRGALEIVGELDTVRAKARWSRQFDGVRPEIDGPEIRLNRARHPMLGAGAVPIDITLPEGVRSLIITGPNTGGKTVALKTVGLLALCRQFGLQIPAEEGSALPLFTAVYADIGDEQSIEQSLSTFSGHMSRIAEIAQQADEHSLVLLDELGAGTDPSEGAAIGAALLEYFAEHSARVLLTTHHGALKRYGFARDDAENASVEFDQDRLAPTYRLLTGVPGASHALEVAETCGVPAEVLERARELLKSGRSGADELVVELTERERRLRVSEDEAQGARRRLQRREQELAEREAEVARRELALRSELAEEHRRLIEESRRRIENLVRSLREGELTREKTKAARSELDALTQLVDDEQTELERDAATQHARHGDSVGDRQSGGTEAGGGERGGGERGGSTGGRPAGLRRGMEVRERSSGRRGVLGPRNSDGSWSVTFGAIRISVPELDLEPVPEDAGAGHGGGRAGDKAQAGATVSYSAASYRAYGNDASRSDSRGNDLGGNDARDGDPSEGPVFELDLRGMRLEQAIAELERQIDRCVLSGTRRFGVIHGKGEGVLQQGTRAFLSEHAAVSEISYARPEDGGHGKTVVDLQA